MAYKIGEELKGYLTDSEKQEKLGNFIKKAKSELHEISGKIPYDERISDEEFWIFTRDPQSNQGLFFRRPSLSWFSKRYYRLRIILIKNIYIPYFFL